MQPDSFTKKVGNYLIFTNRSLGKGAFGTVFYGHKEDDSNLKIAAKVINRSMFQNHPDKDKFIELIRREIKVLQSITNPNIVRLFDAFETVNNIYLLFEFCKDGDLSSYRSKRGNAFLAETEAITFFQHICNGFKTLNSLKIIHRDIKPANILIHDGNAKIADFGFARFTDDINEKAFMTEGIGTPLYMAPEIFNKSSYNSKCDVWSLGILFYELLYGKTPWMGKSSYDLFVNNILVRPLEFPLTPRRSEKVKNLIKKMLVIEVEKRVDWDFIFKDDLMKEGLFSANEIKGKENINENLKRSMITNAYTINKRLVQGHLNLNNEEATKNQEEFQRPKTIAIENKERNSVQESPTHTFVEKPSFDFSNAESKSETSKQIIKKAKNFLFYERNIAFFLKMTCHLLVANFTSEKLKMDDNLLYQIIFLLQKYEMIIMKYVLLAALGKIKSPDFPTDALVIPEYRNILRDLGGDFDECNKVFTQVGDLISDKKKTWEKSMKNNNFLHIAHCELECNEDFCVVFKALIQEFFQTIAFQFKCLTQAVDGGESMDGDYLKLIRYLQICSSVEGPYNYFLKTEMEDSAQMFYHFYDVMNNMEKKHLVADIKKNWV